MKPWISQPGTDKKCSDEPSSQATREQLYDCATLLALSLVHHRAKFGVVPIEQSVSTLSAVKDGTVSKDLLAEGREALEEALQIVKAASVQSSNKGSKEKKQKVKLEEQRQQIRIRVSAPISVLPLKSTTPLNAKLENISWGGAALRLEQSIGETGDFIIVQLPNFRGRQIKLEAEILRMSNILNEREYAVRFSKLRTADEEIFQQLLEFLAESGDDAGQRGSARLTQRIDIQYDSFDEFQATLEDISAGGLGITVPESMELNQSLLAAISTTDDQCQILLRARVVRQQELNFSNIKMFRVGLQFEHSTEDVRDRVNELIRRMATMKPNTKFQLSKD